MPRCHGGGAAARWAHGEQPAAPSARTGQVRRGVRLVSKDTTPDFAIRRPRPRAAPHVAHSGTGHRTIGEGRTAMNAITAERNGSGTWAAVVRRWRRLAWRVLVIADTGLLAWGAG